MNKMSKEEIYINLIRINDIEKQKYMFKNRINNRTETNLSKDSNKILKKVNIFPIKNKSWTYNNFLTFKTNYKIESPLINDKKNFIECEPNKKLPLEITGYIYQLDENINYNKYDNVIKGEIELKENSNFWLFFHCDDNYNFNNKTAVIILSRKHNKNFISLGCFIQSEKEYEFMIFKKQELIEKNDDKNKDNKINILNKYEDKSNFIFNFFDNGDKIECKINLNENKYINEITGDFFFPILDDVITQENYDIKNGKDIENVINLNINENNNSINNDYKIKMAGSGYNCTIISFGNELNPKNQKLEFQTRQGGENCHCCKIF